MTEDELLQIGKSDRLRSALHDAGGWKSSAEFSGCNAHERSLLYLLGCHVLESTSLESQVQEAHFTQNEHQVGHTPDDGGPIQDDRDGQRQDDADYEKH